MPPKRFVRLCDAKLSRHSKNVCKNSFSERKMIVLDKKVKSMNEMTFDYRTGLRQPAKRYTWARASDGQIYSIYASIHIASVLLLRLVTHQNAEKWYPSSRPQCNIDRTSVNICLHPFLSSALRTSHPYQDFEAWTPGRQPGAILELVLA